MIWQKGEKAKSEFNDGVESMNVPKIPSMIISRTQKIIQGQTLFLFVSLACACVAFDAVSDFLFRLHKRKKWKIIVRMKTFHYALTHPDLCSSVTCFDILTDYPRLAKRFSLTFLKRSPRLRTFRSIVECRSTCCLRPTLSCFLRHNRMFPQVNEEVPLRKSWKNEPRERVETEENFHWQLSRLKIDCFGGGFSCLNKPPHQSLENTHCPWNCLCKLVVVVIGGWLSVTITCTYPTGLIDTKRASICSRNVKVHSSHPRVIPTSRIKVTR